MNKQVIGRCSICGGNVTIPNVWLGVIPPKPSCESCGAIKRDNLPIIDMDPSYSSNRKWENLPRNLPIHRTKGPLADVIWSKIESIVSRSGSSLQASR